MNVVEQQRNIRGEAETYNNGSSFDERRSFTTSVAGPSTIDVHVEYHLPPKPRGGGPSDVIVCTGTCRDPFVDWGPVLVP
jgi:hypothetical protein